MKGKLILQDGTTFRGQLFGGSSVTAEGEVVFNTGMTGYQEILTDPSYCKQIVTLTYPLIGNYGTAKQFNQSRKSFVSGLVIGELCVNHSSSSMEKILPEFLTAEKILALNLDGIFLSNGPGDLKDVPDAIREVRKLLDKRPIFGICLGHQILALAMGANTYKLKFGHRGANQPVKNLRTGKVAITS